MAIKIKRGSDKRFKVKLRLPNGDPWPNLNQVTDIFVRFQKSNTQELEVSNAIIPSVASQATVGEVINVQPEVVFTATTPGLTGNLIQLDFDGVLDFDSVVDAWNSANPSNLVTSSFVDPKTEASLTEQSIQFEWSQVGAQFNDFFVRFMEPSLDDQGVQFGLNGNTIEIFLNRSSGTGNLDSETADVLTEQVAFNNFLTLNNLPSITMSLNGPNSVLEQSASAVPFTGGISATVLPPQTVKLTGGLDAVQKVTVDSEEKGFLIVFLPNEDTSELRVGNQQSITVVLDIGAHPTGERTIQERRNAIDVIQ